MSTNQLLCPKCNEPMVQGFILEYGNNDRKSVTQWVEGHPQKSFWTGIKKEKSIPVCAFCCSSCGFLEFYAMDFFAAMK